MRMSYLFQALAVEQHPTDFDDFRRIFGYIDPMLIARGCNVNY